MYIIYKTTAAGTVNTGIECETLDFAIGECKALTNGKTPTIEGEGNYFRLAVWEMLNNGDFDFVYVTDFFAE